MNTQRNQYGYQIVTEPSVNLRCVARQALAGRWGLVIGGSILFIILTFVPAFIFTYLIVPDLFTITMGTYPFEYEYNTLVLIYSIIVSGPLNLGFTRFVMDAFRRKPTSPVEVLSGFEQFGKAFGLYIVMSVFIFLWSLLLIFPGIIASYRYALAYNILADNPKVGILEAIRLSSRMMHGNKWKLFCLNLSFIGWYFLGYLTFGVLLIYVQPYSLAATVAVYEMINDRLVIRHDSGWQEPRYPEEIE